MDGLRNSFQTVPWTRPQQTEKRGSANEKTLNAGKVQNETPQSTTIKIANKQFKIFEDYSFTTPESKSKSLKVTLLSGDNAKGIESAKETLLPKNITTRNRSKGMDSSQLRKSVGTPQELKTPYGLGHLGKDPSEMVDKHESKANEFIKSQLQKNKTNPYQQLADSYVKSNSNLAFTSKEVAYADKGVIDYIRNTAKTNKVEHKQIYNEIMDNVLKSSGKKLEFTPANFNAAKIFSDNSEKVGNFIRNELLTDPGDGKINEFRKITDEYIKKNNIPNKNKEAYSNGDVIDFVKDKAITEKDSNYKLHHAILNHILVGSESAPSTETMIGGIYKFVENKRWGVEPGFEAKKVWTENHSEKINNPQHKYYDVANKFIKENYKEEISKFTAENESLSAEEIINHLKNNNPDVQKGLQKHFYENFKTFQKLHFVKLDYANPVSGLVSIDPGRAITTAGRVKREGFETLAANIEKVNFVNKIARDMHVRAVAETPKEKNLGAIKEALANDIFESLGFGGQKLKLVLSQYDDGASKLLLDGTMVEGPNQEKFSTLKGQIKNGRLENNGITENGVFYPIDPKELAKAKIMTLLMGDRDKIGSEGGNLGYIVVDGKAKLMNIDPGKSLEGVPDRGKTDVMTQKNLHSDISFDQPTEKFKYKNLGIFDDTLLSDKMEGMRTIINSKTEIENVFKSYEKAFDKPGEDLDFKKDIAKIKMRLFDRIDYFEGVLKERVELMNFDKDLGPKALDCLGNIEKAFSETIDHVGEGKDKIAFQHLEIKMATRKEFHLVKDKEGEGFTLSFQGKSQSESVALQRTFKKYLSESSEMQKFTGEIKGNEFKVKISDKNELNSFINFFEENRVA